MRKRRHCLILPDFSTLKDRGIFQEHLMHKTVSRVDEFQIRTLDGRLWQVTEFDQTFHRAGKPPTRGTPKYTIAPSAFRVTRREDGSFLVNFADGSTLIGWRVEATAA
jgi:hypothetical protein